MDCSEADILIFNLQRKCKKTVGAPVGTAVGVGKCGADPMPLKFSCMFWFPTWCSPGNLPFVFLLIMHTYACGCTCISRTTIERNSSLGYHHVVWRKWKYKLKSSIPFFSFFCGTNPKITIESIENLQVVIGVRFWEVVANESLSVRGGGGTPNSKWRGWTNGKENQNPKPSLAGLPTKPKKSLYQKWTPKNPMPKFPNLENFPKTF